MNTFVILVVHIWACVVCQEDDDTVGIPFLSHLHLARAKALHDLAIAKAKLHRTPNLLLQANPDYVEVSSFNNENVESGDPNDRTIVSYEDLKEFEKEIPHTTSNNTPNLENYYRNSSDDKGLAFHDTFRSGDFENQHAGYVPKELENDTKIVEMNEDFGESILKTQTQNIADLGSSHTSPFFKSKEIEDSIIEIEENTSIETTAPDFKTLNDNNSKHSKQKLHFPSKEISSKIFAENKTQSPFQEKSLPVITDINSETNKTLINPQTFTGKQAAGYKGMFYKNGVLSNNYSGYYVKFPTTSNLTESENIMPYLPSMPTHSNKNAYKEPIEDEYPVLYRNLNRHSNLKNNQFEDKHVKFYAEYIPEYSENYTKISEIDEDYSKSILKKQNHKLTDLDTKVSSQKSPFPNSKDSIFRDASPEIEEDKSVEKIIPHIKIYTNLPVANKNNSKQQFQTPYNVDAPKIIAPIKIQPHFQEKPPLPIITNLNSDRRFIENQTVRDKNVFYDNDVLLSNAGRNEDDLVDSIPEDKIVPRPFSTIVFKENLEGFANETYPTNISKKNKYFQGYISLPSGNDKFQNGKIHFGWGTASNHERLPDVQNSTIDRNGPIHSFSRLNHNSAFYREGNHNTYLSLNDSLERNQWQNQNKADRVSSNTEDQWNTSEFSKFRKIKSETSKNLDVGRLIDPTLFKTQEKKQLWTTTEETYSTIQDQHAFPDFANIETPTHQMTNLMNEDLFEATTEEVYSPIGEQQMFSDITTNSKVSSDSSNLTFNHFTTQSKIHQMDDVEISPKEHKKNMTDNLNNLEDALVNSTSGSVQYPSNLAYNSTNNPDVFVHLENKDLVETPTEKPHSIIQDQHFFSDTASRQPNIQLKKNMSNGLPTMKAVTPKTTNVPNHSDIPFNHFATQLKIHQTVDVSSPEENTRNISDNLSNLEDPIPNINSTNDSVQNSSYNSTNNPNGFDKDLFETPTNRPHKKIPDQHFFSDTRPKQPNIQSEENITDNVADVEALTPKITNSNVLNVSKLPVNASNIQPEENISENLTNVEVIIPKTTNSNVSNSSNSSFNESHISNLDIFDNLTDEDLLPLLAATQNVANDSVDKPTFTQQFLDESTTNPLKPQVTGKEYYNSEPIQSKLKDNSNRSQKFSFKDADKDDLKNDVDFHHPKSNLSHLKEPIIFQEEQSREQNPHEEFQEDGILIKSPTKEKGFMLPNGRPMDMQRTTNYRTHSQNRNFNHKFKDNQSGNQELLYSPHLKDTVPPLIVTISEPRFHDLSNKYAVGADSKTFEESFSKLRHYIHLMRIQNEQDARNYHEYTNTKSQPRESELSDLHNPEMVRSYLLHFPKDPHYFGERFRREIRSRKGKKVVENKKRHPLPLISLLLDPKAKLDVPRTVKNFGTVTKNSLEDEKAPVQHVKSMMSSARNAVLAAMRVPPEDMIVPSKYKIVDRNVLKEKASIESRQGDILGESSPNANGSMNQVFQRVGSMMRQSVESGQAALQHFTDIAHNARKVFSSTRESIPRLFFPYIKVPEIIKEENPKKVTVITPRFADIGEETSNSDDDEYLKVGKVMDALGLSHPTDEKIGTMKFVIRPKNKQPVLQSRFGEVSKEEDPGQYVISNRLEGKSLDQSEVTEILEIFHTIKAVSGATTLKELLSSMKNHLEAHTEPSTITPIDETENLVEATWKIAKDLTEPILDVLPKKNCTSTDENSIKSKSRQKRTPRKKYQEIENAEFAKFLAGYEIVSSINPEVFRAYFHQPLKIDHTKDVNLKSVQNEIKHANLLIAPPVVSATALRNTEDEVEGDETGVDFDKMNNS